MTKNLFDIVLSPERDRIARRPLDNWVADLETDFTRYKSLDATHFPYAAFEVVTNNLSLISFYMGFTELAEELCTTSQRFFYDVYVTKANGCPNKFGVIQPYINLIRLDRFLGKIPAAEKKLLGITRHNGLYPLAGYSLMPMQTSNEGLRLMAYCYIDELVKLNLAKRAYSEIISFVTELPIREDLSIPREQLLFLLEARAIALLHVGEADVVPALLQGIIQEAPGQEKLIFHLKYIHWLLQTEKKSQAIAHMEKLLTFLDREIKYPIYKLRYWLSVVRTCHALELFSPLKDLSEWLYERFSQEDDALSVLETAQVMVSMSHSDSKWHTIIDQSTYAQVKRGFAQRRPDWVEQGRLLSKEIIQFMNNQINQKEKLIA